MCTSRQRRGRHEFEQAGVGGRSEKMLEKSLAKKLDDLALENRAQTSPMEKGAISRSGKVRDRISLVKAQARWKRDDIVTLCKRLG